MNKKPLVYIIIANWKRYKDTAECLDSLYNMTYKEFQVIVVDNESQKGDADQLLSKYKEVRLLRNKKNLGFCKGNNQGIKKAIKKGADYVLLLNNDTVVKKDFLEILVDYTVTNNFEGILTPKILYYKSKNVWAMGGSLNILTSIPRMIGQGKEASAYNKVFEPDYASGCALFVNTKALKKIGILDERYFAYYEDTDLSFRAKKSGYKIKVIPESIIWHKVSQSTKQKSGKIGEMQSYLHARNGIYFGRKNLFGAKKIIYLLSQFFIKYPLFILLKCDGSEARYKYSQGLFEGLTFIKK